MPARHYRPDIDGLRAFAVLSVIAYHYGFPLRGGFIGVDIFFVISGYLITGLIAEELAVGGFSIGAFYARRVRRIVPALVVLLLAAMALGLFLLWPGDLVNLSHSAMYAAVGLANWYFDAHTGYFEQAASFQPLLHLWTLGIEEQFYFVWPLALLLASTLGGRRAMLATALLVAVASFVYGELNVRSNPKDIFYLPFGRGWELALGGIVALLRTDSLPRWVAATLAASGLVLLAGSVVFFSDRVSYPGVLALLPCAGAALVLGGGRDGSPTWRLLALRPIRSVGLVSYSLYLWHWPALVFYRHYANKIAVSPLEAVALLVLSLAIAAASWRFVEEPFRRGRARFFRALIAASLAVGVVAAGATQIAAKQGFPERIAPELRKLESLDGMWRWPCPSSARIDGKDYCVIGTDWSEAEGHALLWGDSHAEQLMPELDLVAREQRVAILVNSGCPAMLGGDVQLTIPETQDYNNNAVCRRTYAETVAMLQAHLEIQHVLLAGAWRFSIGLLISDSDRTGSQTALLHDGLLDLAGAIAAPGRRIVVFGDTPGFSNSPLQCLVVNKGLLRAPCGPHGTTVARSAFRAQQGEIDSALLQLGELRSDVQTVLLGEAMCLGERCVSAIDGEFLYRDSDHIRRNLSAEGLAKLSVLFGLDGLISEP